MIVELQRFVEFKDGWHKTGSPPTREVMEFEPVTINTEYITWVKRYCVFGAPELCEVGMIDHNRTFVIDKTYEDMRDLLKHK